GKQLQSRRVRRRLCEDDERVARQELAVQDARAIEARTLDPADEAHELGHRRGARNAHVDANAHGAQSACPAAIPQASAPVYASGPMKALVCRAWGPVDDLK